MTDRMGVSDWRMTLQQNLCEKMVGFFLVGHGLGLEYRLFHM